MERTRYPPFTIEVVGIVPQPTLHLLAQQILGGKFMPGDTIAVDVTEGALTFMALVEGATL